MTTTENTTLVTANDVRFAWEHAQKLLECYERALLTYRHMLTTALEQGVQQVEISRALGRHRASLNRDLHRAEGERESWATDSFHGGSGVG